MAGEDDLDFFDLVIKMYIIYKGIKKRHAYTTVYIFLLAALSSIQLKSKRPIIVGECF